jgi:hypothetical protein
MEQKQEISKEEYENISFAFFTIFNENYYKYSINGLDTFHLIKRENILPFIKCQEAIMYDRINWLTHRFFPFVYDFKNKQLIELEVNSRDEDVEKEIRIKFNIELNSKKKEEKEDSLYRKTYKNLESKIEKFKELFVKMGGLT